MMMEKLWKKMNKIKMRRNGMELEWEWNGTFMKKFGNKKWNGNREEMERKWNGKFMEENC